MDLPPYLSLDSCLAMGNIILWQHTAQLFEWSRFFGLLIILEVSKIVKVNLCGFSLPAQQVEWRKKAIHYLTTTFLCRNEELNLQARFPRKNTMWRNSKYHSYTTWGWKNVILKDMRNLECWKIVRKRNLQKGYLS